jgi:cytochrome c oxidase assembly protein subunit 11
VGKLLLFSTLMFGFGFALIPLYNVLCEITGLNGRTTAKQSTEAAQYAVDDSRQVMVEFVAVVNGTTGWAFQPQVARMRVHPGKSYRTTFYAHNRQDNARVAQAVPSVAPSQAARHFYKTECFCFTRQEFTSGEARQMPVVFMLDPEIPRSVTTVTLSYSFYELPVAADAQDVDRGPQALEEKDV